MLARAAIVVAVVPLALFVAGSSHEPAPPSTCESFITITQAPPSPYYQGTANITVEYGYIETGGCIPPFDGMDPWSNFRFKVNGVDVTNYFDIYLDQAVGTNVPLVDETLNTLTAENLGNDTDGNPRTDTDVELTSVDTTPVPVVSAAPYNYDHQMLGRCAAACFAAQYAEGTVPYFSLDAPWNVTLVYQGERVALRPFLHVDVQVPAGANAPQEFWLAAKVNGVNVTFLNGDQTIRFTGTTQQVRLGGQLLRDTTTRVDSLTIIVTAKWPNKNEQTVVTTRLTTVNVAKSPIARGWAIAGVPQLYSQANGALVVEGDGSAAFYNKACPTCSYTTPVGDVRQLSGPGTDGGWKLISPDTTVVYLNSAGRTDSIVDRFGNRVQLVYDGSNRLSQVRDPLGRNITLAYGTYGLATITDPMGRVTTVSVASDSTLRTIKDPDGDSTRLTYDANRRLASVIDRRGGLTQYFYRSSWKLDSILLPAIPINGGASQAPRIRFSPWQIVGVPTTSTASTPFTPVTPASVQGSVTDPEGHTVSFTVDRWGQPLIVTDPLGWALTYWRNGAGLPTAIDSRGGYGESYTYDTNNRVTSSSATGVAATNIHYGAKGQPDSIWGTAQAHLRFFLDAASGRADSVRIAYQDSIKYRVAYNSRGQVTKVRDPRNDSTLYHYDATFANFDSALAPGTRFVRVRFDAYGRDSAMTANGLPWRRVIYDAVNRPRQLYDGVNASPTILGYDQLYLTRVQDPKSQVYRFELNALGLAVKRFDPADTLNRFDAYRYDRDGQLIGWTNRRSQALSFTYDSLHRLRSKSGTNTVVDSFAYATDGRRFAAWNAIVRDSMYLAPGGWRDSTVTRIAGRRFRIRYHVNAVAAIDSIKVTDTTGPTGLITFPTRRFFRNAASQRLDSLGLGALRIRTPRNADGFPISTALPTTPAVSRVLSYTTLHNLWTDSLSNANLDGAFGRVYGYDALNRLAHATNADGTYPTGRDFYYDGLGRLTGVDYGTYGPASACSGNGVNDGWICYISNPALGQYPDSSKTYTYDQVGNRTDQSGSYASGNRIQSFAGLTFAQDLDGNDTLKTGGGQTYRYAWSAEGRLQSVVANGTTVTYRYDALGRLVRRVRASDSTTFLWEADQVLAELTGGATARVGEYAYYSGIDRPMALITGATSPGVTRLFSQDALGNVVGVFRDTLVHQRITYDAWGVQQQVTGTLADTNRLRWKGLLWDGSSGLYFMRTRWYDPQTGRFVSEDPLGLAGGLNTYAFARSDPVNGRDPYGLCWPPPAPVWCFAALDAALYAVAGVTIYEMARKVDWRTIIRVIGELLLPNPGPPDPPIDHDRKRRPDAVEVRPRPGERPPPRDPPEGSGGGGGSGSLTPLPGGESNVHGPDSPPIIWGRWGGPFSYPFGYDPIPRPQPLAPPGPRPPVQPTCPPQGCPIT